MVSFRYQGNRKNNFVKPAEQVVVDFGAKGVTIDMLALIGNMHYSFKLGDAAMRLSGASVKAWIAKLGLPCTKKEDWTNSQTTGDAYRVLEFGSKQIAATGSAFDDEPTQGSAF